MEKTPEQIRSEVSEYYGKTLQGTQDLKTDCCSCSCEIPETHKPILAKIHPEILSHFYGCGTPLPELLDGQTILDLGCGTGRDVYLCSALVGARGRVIGVDMTDEQLAIATKHIEYHRQQFNLPQPNVVFHKGNIENLRELSGGPIPDSSVDIVISNCVINLSADKQAVFNEVHRVLREGGELCFSDIFADRRIPESLRANKVLWGECLSGAMYIQDFRRALLKAGFPQYSVVSLTPVNFNNEQVEKQIGAIKFFSATIRAFKISTMEDQCEDFGQEATYKGTIPGEEEVFTLDQEHRFRRMVPARVCGNTAGILMKSRLALHFLVTPPGPHAGLFPCGMGDDDDDCGCGCGGCGDGCGCGSGPCGSGPCDSGPCGCGSGPCGPAPRAAPGCAGCSGFGTPGCRCAGMEPAPPAPAAPKDCGSGCGGFGTPGCACSQMGLRGCGSGACGGCPGGGCCGAAPPQSRPPVQSGPSGGPVRLGSDTLTPDT